MVKKAFVFSFIAIIVVFVFGIIISIFITSIVNPTEPDFAYKARALNQFYDLLIDHYVPQILKSSSAATLRELADIAGTHGLLVNETEFQNTYRSLLYQGFFEYDSEIYGNMSEKNATLEYWTNFLENRIRSLYLIDRDIIEINPVYNSIVFSQNDPWNIQITAIFDILLSTDDFSLSDRFTFRVTLPIEDFVDPLYAAHSFGNLNHKIQGVDEVITSDWSLGQFSQAVTGGNYYRSSRAPSFLDRFQNRTLPNSFAGIESFINPVWLSNQLVHYNTTRNSRSHIDYLFFSNAYADCVSPITSDRMIYRIDAEGILEDARFDFQTAIRYLGPPGSLGSSNYNLITVCPTEP